MIEKLSLTYCLQAGPTKPLPRDEHLPPPSNPHHHHCHPKQQILEFSGMKFRLVSSGDTKMRKTEKHPYPSQDTYLPPSPVHREASLEGREREREMSAQLKERLFPTGGVV